MPKGTKVNAPVYDQNITTVTRWVEEASDGVFTVTPADRLADDHYPRFPGSLVRADGAPFGYEGGDVPITGVALTLFVSAFSKLDNRHTTTKREVGRTVTFAIENLRRYPGADNVRLANQAENALFWWGF